MVGLARNGYGAAAGSAHDRGIVSLGEADRRELLETFEDRHELRSTLVTSQLPVEKWYDAIDHPTLALAILDCLGHGAYRIALHGESMRRKKAAKQKPSS